MDFADRPLGFLLTLLIPAFLATVVWVGEYSVVGLGVFVPCWAVPTLIVGIPELFPDLSPTVDAARRLLSLAGFLVAIVVTVVPR